MPPLPASPDLARPPTPWWTVAFGAPYRTVYAHRDDAEARRNAPAIVAWLGLVPPARILDLACGEGRYARALASRGFRVTGVDLSDDLLAQARRRSPSLPDAPSYVRADMRALPFGRQFDAVVSLFTSFGYFDDPADDQAVLDGVARVLVPGGHFLLDYLAVERVRATLVAADREERDPYRIDVARRVDEAAAGGPCVRKDVRVTDLRTGRLVFRVEERVRLYEPARLDAMLRRAGLEPEGEARGDFTGAPASAAAPRWIRVARRPGGGR